MVHAKAMIEIKKLSPENILQLRPPRDVVWKNEYKTWRESWCVAKLCEICNLGGLITAPFEEPVDVLLELNSSCQRFQIVECKNSGSRGSPLDIPQSLKIENEQEDTIPVYDVSLQETNLTQKIIDAISNKERHYNSSDKQNINLLIYQNFYFCNDEDIQLNRIQESIQNFDFKTITMFDGKTINFIKGNICSECSSEGVENAFFPARLF